MTYYRFKGKDDLFVGKYVQGKSKWKDTTLLPNELLTQQQIDSLSKDCPRLSIDKAFEKLNLNKDDVYSSFGAKFQVGWDVNGKQEESFRRRSGKLSIKESDFTRRYDFSGLIDIIGTFASNIAYDCKDISRLTKSGRDDGLLDEYYDILDEMYHKLGDYADDVAYILRDLK